MSSDMPRYSFTTTALEVVRASPTLITDVRATGIIMDRHPKIQPYDRDLYPYQIRIEGVGHRIRNLIYNYVHEV